MTLKIEREFLCPPEMRVHLEKVFAGEYEIPFNMHGLTILDLGANCGAFSVWASHRFPGCRIHAYEPHPDNILYFEMNLKGYYNVTLHNYAVGSPGMRVLNDGKFNQGEASLHTILNNPMPTGRHVEVVDPLTLPEADILKMDIEGSEIEVLPQVINRNYAAIVFEYHAENIRRELDQLLTNYVLTGSTVECVLGRGVVRYVRRDLL
jgi:FkbM family methyltransferase